MDGGKERPYLCFCDVPQRIRDSDHIQHPRLDRPQRRNHIFADQMVVHTLTVGAVFPLPRLVEHLRRDIHTDQKTCQRSEQLPGQPRTAPRVEDERIAEYLLTHNVLPNAVLNTFLRAFPLVAPSVTGIAGCPAAVGPYPRPPVSLLAARQGQHGGLCLQGDHFRHLVL